MPGFTIHIIIAKEYIKKHPNEIKNEKDFIRGSISPDLTTNKNKTHYGTWEKYILITHLNRMLKDPEVYMKQCAEFQRRREECEKKMKNQGKLFSTKSTFSI